MPSLVSVLHSAVHLQMTCVESHAHKELSAKHTATCNLPLNSPLVDIPGVGAFL